MEPRRLLLCLAVASLALVVHSLTEIDLGLKPIHLKFDKNDIFSKNGTKCQITDSFITRIVPQACLLCTCFDDGSYKNCEVEHCQSDVKARQNKRECWPGKIMNDKCNVCYCTKQYVKVCSNRVCPNYYPLKQDVACVPNAKFNMYCNECLCNKDGTAAHCTNRKPWECGNSFPIHLNRYNNDFSDENSDEWS